MDLHGRNLLKEIDLTAEEFLYLVHLAGTLRTEKRLGQREHQLAGRNIALIFEKASTRARSAGSMGPKAEAACRFVEATGGMAAIGRLDDAEALLDGKAGTIVVPANARPP